MKHKNELMKHFASVLRAASKNETGLNPTLLKYLSRKDLVQILLAKFKGNLPKHLDLIEMENEALLELIGNDLFVLSYFVPLWCEEIEQKPELSPAQALEQGKTKDSSKKSGKNV